MLGCMSLAPNVRDLLEGHIGLELESIDRLYLNGYVPQLQHGAGLVGFLCQQRGQPIASPALLGHITGKFVAEVKAFANECPIKQSAANHRYRTGSILCSGVSRLQSCLKTRLICHTFLQNERLARYSFPPESFSSSSSFSFSIFERC